MTISDGDADFVLDVLCQQPLYFPTRRPCPSWVNRDQIRPLWPFPVFPEQRTWLDQPGKKVSQAASYLRQNNPTGKFSLSPSGKSILDSRHPVPEEGALAIVTERWDGMRWTRRRRARVKFAGRFSVSGFGSAQDERCRSVRRSRVDLTPQWLASSLNGGAEGPTGPMRPLP